MKSKSLTSLRPFWYILPTLLAILVLFLAVLVLPNGCGLCDVLIGIASGVLASAIVSFLIDVGQTKRNLKCLKSFEEDCKRQLVCSCMDLESEIETIVFDIRMDEEFGKRDYEGWVDALLETFSLGDGVGEACARQIEGLVSALDSVRKAADSAALALRQGLLNDASVNEEIEALERLKGECRKVAFLIRCKKYERALRALGGELAQCMKCVSADLHIYLEKPRDYEDGEYER